MYDSTHLPPVKRRTTTNVGEIVVLPQQKKKPAIFLYSDAVAKSHTNTTSISTNLDYSIACSVQLLTKITNFRGVNLVNAQVAIQKP
jgi:hypothetical protein